MALPNDQRTRQFLLLLGQHERRLEAFILSLVPNWADADDIAQEVKLRVWEQLDSYDPTKDFGAWVRAIAHFQVLSHRKRQTRERRRISDEFVEAIAQEAWQLSDEVDAGQQALRDCFERLPAAKRDLLAHYYSGGQTMREIAEELGRTCDSMRQAILRARITLRECIEETLQRAAGMRRAGPEENRP